MFARFAASTLVAALALTACTQNKARTPKMPARPLSAAADRSIPTVDGGTDGAPAPAPAPRAIRPSASAPSSGVQPGAIERPPQTEEYAPPVSPSSRDLQRMKRKYSRAQ